MSKQEKGRSMKTGKIIRRFTAKDGREVILRTPRWEDLDDLTEFINSLVEEGADIDKDQKVTKEQEAEWLRRRLADLENDKVFCLVAEIDGKVVANSEITKRGGYSRHVSEVGIAIRKGYLKILTLSVFSTNARAIHVYRKVGFKETGRIPKNIYKDGKYIDKIIMTREI